MADTNSENIGGINVSIGADYSDLQAAFTGAESAATAAGQQIGASLTAGFSAAGQEVTEFASLFSDIPWDQTKTAFADLGTSAQEAAEQLSSASATGSTAWSDLTAQIAAAQEPISETAQQLNLFGDALNNVPFADAAGQLNLFANELEPVSAAEDTVAGSTAGVGSAMATAAPQIQGAESSLGDLAKQLIAVSAAMVLVNRITDLGAAALEASDNITRAQISLTALTGSAQTATDDIAKLEALGQSDGLSMPSLLEASARMQSLLGPGANVVGVLGDLANSAAVSGQNIETAAQAFDRIATSGAVAQRSLQPLGINLSDLAAAFNTLTGTSYATDTSIKTLLTTMSEPEKVEILQQALSKLNGIAAQVKDETFGGQWAALVAQWSTVMADAGKALLPVIDDLIQLTQTEIVPFLKSAIDEFSALPGPVKDAVIELGLFAGAAITLAAGLGTLGIALSGVSKLAATLGLASVGTEAAAAAPEIATAGTAIEGVGAAAVTTGAELGTAGLAGAITLVLIPAVAAAGAAYITFKGQTKDLQDALSGLGTTLGTVAENITTAVSSAVQSSGALDGFKAQWKDAQTVITGVADAIVSHLQNIGKQTIDGINTWNDLIQVITGAAPPLNATGSALESLVGKFANTKEAADAVAASFAAAKPKIDLVADDITNLNKTLAASQQTFDTATGAYNRLNAELAQGKANPEQVAAALNALNDAFAKLPGVAEPVSLALANQAAGALKATQEYQTLQGVYQTLLSSGTATAGQLATAFQKMEAAEASAATAGVPVAGSLQAIDIQANAAINSSKLLATNFGVLSDMATAQTDALSDNDAQVAILSQKLDLLVTAQQNVAAKVAAGTAQYSQQVEIQKQVVSTAGQLQDALDKQATANLNAGNQAAIAGGDVGVLKQQLDLANLSLEQATTKADAGTISIAAWASAQKAATTAAINLAEGAAEAASGMKGSTDALSLLGTEAAGATGKLQALTQAYKDGKIGPQDYASGVTAALNAQIAFDGQRAISDAGLADSTTQWGLLQAAVLLAKAKVDDLTTAQSQGIPVQEQLTQATADLKTKQDAYNAAVSASHTPLTTASTDVKALTYDAANAIPVMGDLGVAMGDVGVKALGMATSVQSAVNSVEAAINSITGTSAGFSGSGRVTETGFGSFGQPIYSVTASIPPETIFKEAMEAALAAADQQTNPNNSANPLTVAQEALAEATATLKVDQQYFGQTSSTGSQLVTVSALQSAQSAVATAQSALANLQGGSSAGAVVLAPGGGVVGTVVNGVVVPAGSATSTSTATATTSTATGGDSEDTSSYGGSYPGVVAHQAAGEVWVVDTSGVASGSSAGTATAAAGGASDLASGSTADVVASAADTIADVTQALSSITQSLVNLNPGQYAAIDTAGVATGGTTGIGSVTSATGYFAVNGIVVYLVNGQLANGDYNGLAFVNGVATGVAASAAASSGPIGNYSGTLPATGGTFTAGGNPAGPTVPVTPPQAQTPGVAAGSSSQQYIVVNVDARGVVGVNATQFAAQVTGTVQKNLTQNLFAAGARLTQA